VGLEKEALRDDNCVHDGRQVKDALTEWGETLWLAVRLPALRLL